MALKIRKVAANNRKRVFEVRVGKKVYTYPYARLSHGASAEAFRVAEASVDAEIGGEGFTYRLESGAEGTVLLDEVLDYNRDPAYVRDALLYRLTLEALKRVEKSRLSRREIIRRMGTSATQFYRLLDPTNYRKSLDQMVKLLQVLDCEVDLKVRNRTA